MEDSEVESSAITVIEAPGRLPAFWDHKAVFVANLMGLFFGNEEEARLLAEEVGEVDSYGGRLIPIIDILFSGTGENLLVLEREPDSSLCRYFEERAGLTLPEKFILPHREYLEVGRALAGNPESIHDFLYFLGEHPSQWVDGYVTDDILAGVADRIGKKTISTPQGSRLGNNKRALHQFLELAGLPVAPTELANSPEEIGPCLKRIRAEGYSAGVVKAAIGASGIGLIKVDSIDDADADRLEIPEHFFFEGACLVQGWLKPGEHGVKEIRSPSAQLFLSSDSVTIYDLTEQILSHESVHEGNEAPPSYLGQRPEVRAELLRQAGIAGKWLHSQGYRGTGSVDFLAVEKTGGACEVYVCEINARVTGATYPSILARHFIPEGAWLLRNLRFETPLKGEELLDLLEKSGDLFLPGQTDFGVMPVNFNFGADGLVHKGQFLCLAPTSAGSHGLLKMAELDLPCAPDRD